MNSNQNGVADAILFFVDWRFPFDGAPCGA
jgi:hypothetical protein